MEIIKTKLQIIVGIVICVLIYMHFNKPKVEQEVTMDTIQTQSAAMKNSPMSGSAQLKAQQIMNTGDIQELENQMGEMGLLK